MVLNLRYIDKKKLFELVLGDTYVDWESINLTVLPLQQNMLGDCSVWIHLMNLFDFSKLVIPDKMLQTNHPLLYTLYTCMRQTGCYNNNILSTTNVNMANSSAEAVLKNAQSSRLCFNDVCRLFVLINVENMQSSNTVQMYVGNKLPTAVANKLYSSIMSSIADVRQSADEYIETFHWIFSDVTVDEKHLCDLIAHHKRVVACR